MIAVGDRLPELTFKVIGADGTTDKTTTDLFGAKTAVLFGVPGAFTPTCHQNHLPGFLDQLDAFAAKGVTTVAVIGVNDPFVMSAWAKATGGLGKILFLADGSAVFAKATGLELDASGFALGIRNKRFAMVIEDATVRWLAIEPSPGQADATSASSVLAAL